MWCRGILFAVVVDVVVCVWGGEKEIDQKSRAPFVIIYRGKL